MTFQFKNKPKKKKYREKGRGEQNRLVAPQITATSTFAETILHHTINNHRLTPPQSKHHSNHYHQRHSTTPQTTTDNHYHQPSTAASAVFSLLATRPPFSLSASVAFLPPSRPLSLSASFTVATTSDSLCLCGHHRCGLHHRASYLRPPPCVTTSDAHGRVVRFATVACHHSSPRSLDASVLLFGGHRGAPSRPSRGGRFPLSLLRRGFSFLTDFTKRQSRPLHGPCRRRRRDV